MEDKNQEEMSDRDLLLRIDERTKNLDLRMNGLASRVRELEVKVWIAIGGVIVLAFLLKTSDLKLQLGTSAAAAVSSPARR